MSVLAGEAARGAAEAEGLARHLGRVVALYARREHSAERVHTVDELRAFHRQVEDVADYLTGIARELQRAEPAPETALTTTETPFLEAA